MKQSSNRGAEKITVAGKAGNLLHSAKEIGINECLIAGEEILNATHTHTHTQGVKNTHKYTPREETELIFCTHVGVLYAHRNVHATQVAACFPKRIHMRVHTHTLLMKLLFHLVCSIPQTFNSSPLLHPSIPPALSIHSSRPPADVFLKKRQHTHFYSGEGEKKYKNISPAAHIDLADLLGSRPLFPTISYFASCFSSVLRHAQTILQSFLIPSFALPPTLLCPRSQTSSPPPLQLSLSFA